MKKKIFRPNRLPGCFFILFLLFLHFPVASEAKEETQAPATVTALRGAVQAINAQGEMRNLAVKSPLQTEDTIKTGKTGRVQILFSDSTIYSLGQNSEMKIAEYMWEAGNNKGALKTKVKEGVFRVMGGAITRVSPQNFITETPAATIGIRGSIYAGIVTDSTLLVVFQGGKGITVTNTYGTVAISRPGYGTNVNLNAAPETPRKLSEQDLAAFSDELNPDADNKENGESPASGQQSSTGGNGEKAAETDGATQQSQDALPDDAPLITETALPATAIEVPPPNEFAPVTPSPPGPEIPTDGITSYAGTLSGTVTNAAGTTGTINDTFRMEANWYNGKVLGRVKGETGGPPIFFIGNTSGDQIVNVKILGGNIETPDATAIGNKAGMVTSINGSAAGRLGGTDYDLFIFIGTGNSYEVEPFSQPWHDKWEIAGTGIREIQNPADVVSPRGVSGWKGFVTGISENMSHIDSFRRLFMNSAANDFSFTVDKDHGTLSGSLSAADVNGSYARLVNIDMGGSLASSFVLEDNFAAELGCASGNCVHSGTSDRAGLKTYGNYMISAAPEDNPISDYVTWGYWEIAYEDPATGSQYHTHVPGSRWIAGEPTPAAEVDELATANFTGRYSGTAYASRIDTTAAKQVADLKGTAAIDVDFGNINAAGAVQGTINLGEIVLNVNSGPAGNASASGFSNTRGGVTGPAGVLPNSTFNGAFFGPKAAAIAGNFYAPFSSGVSYIGIYGGSR